MDGRGRALDNIFVERLWRSVKYEKVYLNDFQTVKEAYQGLEDYFEFYNHRRMFYYHLFNLLSSLKDKSGSPELPIIPNVQHAMLYNPEAAL